MTDGEHGEPHAADLIPTSVIRRVADERRADGELALVTHQLSQAQEFRRSVGADSNDYIDGLAERRARLLEQVRPAAAPAGPASSRRPRPLDALVTGIGPFFTPWKVVNLPYFAEGIDETPVVGGTHGSIDTNNLFPGGVEFSGNPDDGESVQPTVKKWWRHSWTCSYVFAPAPSNGTLYYRFAVETKLDFVRAQGLSGLAFSFVTSGLTPNVATSDPFGEDAQTDIALPFWFVLSDSEIHPKVNEPVVYLAGSIDVQAGHNAALGLICGIEAAPADGYVQIVGGSMQTRLNAEPGPAETPAIFDQIEYRFEPSWWVKAVEQRLQVT